MTEIILTGLVLNNVTNLGVQVMNYGGVGKHR